MAIATVIGYDKNTTCACLSHNKHNEDTALEYAAAKEGAVTVFCTF
jgi:hypothetical protein